MHPLTVTGSSSYLVDHDLAKLELLAVAVIATATVTVAVVVLGGRRILDSQLRLLLVAQRASTTSGVQRSSGCTRRSQHKPQHVKHAIDNEKRGATATN